MSMHIILLKDLSEDTTDAVIISKKKDDKQIQKIIDKVKAKNEGYWSGEDITEALNENECFIYWGDDCESVWY